MLTEIDIEGFKSIEQESLKLAPLTVLTGVNSSGKSTVIQALLLLLRFAIPVNQFSLKNIISPYSNPRDMRNKFTNQSNTNITLKLEGNDLIDELSLTTIEGEQENTILFRGRIKPAKVFLDKIEETKTDDYIPEPPVVYHYEQVDNDYLKQPELFYLNANRIGPQAVSKKSDSKVGEDAELLFGYFDKIKGSILPDKLVKFDASKTIGYQVSQWISYISGSVIEIKTEKLESNLVNVTFDSDGLEDLSPLNLGAGISYLAKVVIICLIAKKGDLVIIENPEIHLHPKAQSGLGEFFCFISNYGIQLIIETHCEHLINKIAYEVYEDEILADDVVIHYKRSIKQSFDTIIFDDNGEFNNKNGDIVSFPTGFFDATLTELMKMR